MEEWKLSKKYTNYEMSTKGKIRNAKTGKILKTHINKYGYEQVSLRHNNKPKTLLVHKLIADTFIEGDHTGLDIVHKNSDRTKNELANLEYKTRKEIARSAFDRGTRVSPNCSRIRVIETGAIFNSIRECSRIMGISESCICRCINGAMRHANGFHFERIK